MNNQYDHHIEAILAGSPINAEAKKAGVNMNTLRRLLIKHSDYDAARAAGKLHQKGITPKLEAMAKTSPAVAEVVAGATLLGTAAKYGLPTASLAKMVRFAHPDLSLQHRGKSPDEVAELAMKKAQRALRRAEQLRPREP